MIKGIQLHLTVDITVKELAELLEATKEEVVSLWDTGNLKEELEALGLETVIGAIKDAYSYGGFSVGSGWF